MNNKTKLTFAIPKDRELTQEEWDDIFRQIISKYIKPVVIIPEERPGDTNVTFRRILYKHLEDKNYKCILSKRSSGKDFIEGRQ